MIGLQCEQTVGPMKVCVWPLAFLLLFVFFLILHKHLDKTKLIAARIGFPDQDIMGPFIYYKKGYLIFSILRLEASSLIFL